jgi:hypothetical protein
VKHEAFHGCPMFQEEEEEEEEEICCLHLEGKLPCSLIGFY